jgi:putative transcriptional regulator
MKKKPDHEKMSVYEQMLEGLTEGLAHARGKLNLKTTTLPAPAPTLSKARVVAIREKTGMSQAVFACYLNVPKKTLQSWEQGARTPKAGEARLLQVFEFAPEQIVTIVSDADAPRPGKSHRPTLHRAKARA